MSRSEIMVWIIMPIWVLCLMGGAVIVARGLIELLWFLLGPQ